MDLSDVWDPVFFLCLVLGSRCAQSQEILNRDDLFWSDAVSEQVWLNLTPEQLTSNYKLEVQFGESLSRDGLSQEVFDKLT